MTATLLSMTVPVVVLLVLGSLIIGLAWWLVVQAEGKDEWILGDDRYPFKVVCPQCGMTLARASHSGACEIRCHSNCGFEGTVQAIEVLR